ncbi:hypothetical protein [Endozoicomonas lisbonensis]
MAVSAIVYLPKTLFNAIPKSIFSRSASVCSKALFYSCRAGSSALYEMAYLEESGKNAKRFGRWCVNAMPALKSIERSLPAKATLLTCRAICAVYTHTLGYGIGAVAFVVSLGQTPEVVRKIWEAIGRSDALQDKIASIKRSVFEQVINDDHFLHETCHQIMDEFIVFFDPAVELISGSNRPFKKADCEKLVQKILRHSNESSYLSKDIFFSAVHKIVANRKELIKQCVFNECLGISSRQLNKKCLDCLDLIFPVPGQIKSLLKTEGVRESLIEEVWIIYVFLCVYLNQYHTDFDLLFSLAGRKKIVDALSKKLGSVIYEQIKIKAKNKRDERNERKRIDRLSRENSSVKPERSQAAASTEVLQPPPAMTFGEIENACTHLLKKPSPPGDKTKKSNKAPEPARIIAGPASVQAGSRVLSAEEKDRLYGDLQSVFQGQRESLINLKKCLDSLETFSWSDQALLRRCTTYTLQPDDDQPPVPVFHISAGKRGSPEAVTVFFAQLDNTFECLAVARHKGTSKGSTAYTCEYQNDQWKVPKHLSYGESRNIRLKSDLKS